MEDPTRRNGRPSPVSTNTRGISTYRIGREGAEERQIAALTSTLHWFDAALLTREEHLVGLMAVNRDVIGQADTWDRSDRTVLDMNSSESPVHGQQEGSAYNGHFESVCYDSLFLSQIT